MAKATNETIRNDAAFIWSVADLLRGDYKQRVWAGHPPSYRPAAIGLRARADEGQGCWLRHSVTRLDRSNLLYLVVSKFAEIDLHPDAVSNLEMGYLYEELVRGSPTVERNGDLLTKPGISKPILDPACGTGRMLSVVED